MSDKEDKGREGKADERVAAGHDPARAGQASDRPQAQQAKSSQQLSSEGDGLNIADQDALD